MATEQTWVPLTEQERKALQSDEEDRREAGLEMGSPSEAAYCREAENLRAEIVEVGRKLWEREYVDGNGGNISARLGSKYVLCTPTKMCKRDMTPADLCLSDLEGNILAGDRMRTSELLLHLEIYKANSRARAIVHCHPPYATAFAMTGSAPPIGLISEYESSIGPAAVAPYETPGTQAFAETVLPFVEDHNTILLANHGIVCWADTVSHAEWLVETFETYCKTYLIAQQIGKPVRFIPESKIEEILAVKRRLGLPDTRNTKSAIKGR
ncbi:MAG: class II aldolase/adducin family protein [Terracidiphilus sp.]|jgi:L-fuculose-phosphate aldolase